MTYSEVLADSLAYFILHKFKIVFKVLIVWNTLGHHWNETVDKVGQVFLAHISQLIYQVSDWLTLRLADLLVCEGQEEPDGL